VTNPIENGFVLLPMEADWLPLYLQELTTFPNGNHSKLCSQGNSGGAL
jgi:phage terminase large subunit-like protein